MNWWVTILFVENRNVIHSWYLMASTVRAREIVSLEQKEMRKGLQIILHSLLSMWSKLVITNFFSNLGQPFVEWTINTPFGKNYVIESIRFVVKDVIWRQFLEGGGACTNKRAPDRVD